MGCCCSKKGEAPTGDEEDKGGETPTGNEEVADETVDDQPRKKRCCHCCCCFKTNNSVARGGPGSEGIEGGESLGQPRTLADFGSDSRRQVCFLGVAVALLSAAVLICSGS